MSNSLLNSANFFDQDFDQSKYLFMPVQVVFGMKIDGNILIKTNGQINCDYSANSLILGIINNAGGLNSIYSYTALGSIGLVYHQIQLNVNIMSSVTPTNFLRSAIANVTIEVM